MGRAIICVCMFVCVYTHTRVGEAHLVVDAPDMLAERAAVVFAAPLRVPRAQHPVGRGQRTGRHVEPPGHPTPFAHIHSHTRAHTHIQRERERERENIYIYLYIYLYIHIYIYTYTCIMYACNA
jgi:hypothetical protein